MRIGRPVALVLAGVVAGAALAGGTTLLLLDRSGDGPAPPASHASAPALTPEGSELAELMKKGLDATYHARYQSAIADPRAQGTQMTMDVWRKGELTRQEVAVQAQNAKTRSATFQLPPHTFECTQVGDNPWTCKPPSDSKPVDSPEAKIQQELGRGAITARDETIGGVPVRCFAFPAGGDVSETCLMNDGVVARIASTSSRFEIVAFSGAVPDDAFALPAATG